VLGSGGLVADGTRTVCPPAATSCGIVHMVAAPVRVVLDSSSRGWRCILDGCCVAGQGRGACSAVKASK